MKDKIKYNFGGEELEFIRVNDIFAYKDDIIYPVYKSPENLTCANYIGRVLCVFDIDEKCLATAYPMLNFNNGFEKVTLRMVEKWTKVVFAYFNFKESGE